MKIQERVVNDTERFKLDIFGEKISSSEGDLSELSLALFAGKAILSEKYHKEFQSIQGIEVSPYKTIERRRSAHQVGFGAIVSRRHSIHRRVRFVPQPTHPYPDW